MKLKEWSEKAGVKYLTAYRWFKAGTLPVEAYQTQSGTILIKDESFDQPEQSMKTLMINTQKSNDIMSLVLRKTVELSKSDSGVEDFAAWILSNFTLKLNAPEAPIYSKMKPKSGDVQNHFKQFIPKGEKPKSNMFVATEDEMGDLMAQSNDITTQELLNEINIIKDEGGFSSDTDLKELPEVMDLIKDLKHSEIVGGVVRSDNLAPQFNYTAPNSSPDDSCSFASSDADIEFPVNFKLTKKELEQQSLPVKTKRTRKDKRNSK